MVWFLTLARNEDNHVCVRRLHVCLSQFHPARKKTIYNNQIDTLISGVSKRPSLETPEDLLAATQAAVSENGVFTCVNDNLIMMTLFKYVHTVARRYAHTQARSYARTRAYNTHVHM